VSVTQNILLLSENERDNKINSVKSTKTLLNFYTAMHKPF